MSYEIEVNLPNRPKGDKVAITGLGEFVNGKTSKVDDELVELFRLNNEVRDEEGNIVKSGALGSQHWPEGVKVHVVKKEENKPAEAPKTTEAKADKKSEGSDK